MGSAPSDAKSGEKDSTPLGKKDWGKGSRRRPRSSTEKKKVRDIRQEHQRFGGGKGLRKPSKDDLLQRLPKKEKKALRRRVQEREARKSNSGKTPEKALMGRHLKVEIVKEDFQN